MGKGYNYLTTLNHLCEGFQSETIEIMDIILRVTDLVDATVHFDEDDTL